MATKNAKQSMKASSGWVNVEGDGSVYAKQVSFDVQDEKGRQLGARLYVSLFDAKAGVWEARIVATREGKKVGAAAGPTTHKSREEAMTAVGARAIAAEKNALQLAAAAKAAAETKVSRGPSKAVVKAAAAKLKAELESPEMAAAFKAPIPKARGTRKAPAAAVSARKSAKGPAAPAAPEQLDMLTAIYPKGIAVTEYPKLLKALVDVMKPAQPAKAVFTVKEISELIGVTRATVQVWIGEKKLTGKRNGWKFLVPRASLEKFLASTGRDVSVLG